MKILVVDDIEVNRYLLKKYLQKYNFDIIEAANGKEALDILKKIDVKIVLTDIEMPIMNGIKLLQIIKASYYLPVIVISSNCEIINTCFQLGAHAYLIKPINENVIVNAITYATKTYE